MISSRIFSRVEIRPIRGAVKSGRRPYVFNDVISFESNKTVSSATAGNFTVKLGLERGVGIRPEFNENDLVYVYLRRGDNRFSDDDIVWVGQIDRISRVGSTERVDYVVRGKDLTKQFLTQILYLAQVSIENIEGENVEILGPKNWTYFTLAANLGVETRNVTLIPAGQVPDDPDTEDVNEFEEGVSVPGVPLKEFLDAFIESTRFIDPDLLLLPQYIDKSLSDLVIYNNATVGYQSIYKVIEGLADRPFYFWYVSHRGQFVFRKWHWRYPFDRGGVVRSSVSNGIVVCTEEDYINDHTSVVDHDVIGAIMITPVVNVITGTNIFTSIKANNWLLARYGMRFKEKESVPYIYSNDAAEDRADEELQMQYSLRVQSQLTVHGDSKWEPDQWCYVERLGAFFYIDGVQHRFELTDQGAVWNTNLTLTCGRDNANDFVDIGAGYATIAREQGEIIVPESLNSDTVVRAIKTLTERKPQTSEE